MAGIACRYCAFCFDEALLIREMAPAPEDVEEQDFERHRALMGVN